MSTFAAAKIILAVAQLFDDKLMRGVNDRPVGEAGGDRDRATAASMKELNARVQSSRC